MTNWSFAIVTTSGYSPGGKRRRGGKKKKKGTGTRGEIIINDCRGDVHGPGKLNFNPGLVFLG